MSTAPRNPERLHFLVNDGGIPPAGVIVLELEERVRLSNGNSRITCLSQPGTVLVRRSLSSVRLIVDQTVIQGGNRRFSILDRTTIEGGGGARTGSSCLIIGNDLIQDADRHRSQQLDLGNVDPEGILELGTESSGYDGICISNASETERNYAAYPPVNLTRRM